MPKSKHRKKHYEKVKSYNKQKLDAKRTMQNRYSKLIEQLIKQQSEANSVEETTEATVITDDLVVNLDQ